MRTTRLLPALLALPALAQDVETLVLEGDTVSGVGQVSRVDNLAVDDTGAWFVEADTDHADSDADSVLLDPAGLFLREGQALTAPSGSTLDSFDSVTRNVAGQGGFNFFLDGTSGFGDDSGVYVDDSLIIQESDTVDSSKVSAGTPYIGFFDVKINDAEQLFLMASIDDPAIDSSVDRALVVVQTSNGAYVSTDLRWKEGDILPGQTEAIEDFETGPHDSAIDENGSLLFVADLEGDSSLDGAVYLDSTELAQEGDPSPVAGRNWSSLGGTEVDLSADGGHVYTGTLDGDTATNTLIVRNGAKLVQEGDVLPGTNGFGLTSFGSGPVRIDASGNVLWYGDWSDPDTDVDTGLFLNHTLLVQEGVTTVGGVVIDSLSGVQDGFDLSPSGGFVVFEATLENGRNGAFLLKLPIGERYCSPAVPNSTGQPGVIEALGSPVAGGNPLCLRATQLPPNQFGYFVASTTQGFVMNPGGSQGNLCLGGSIKRYAKQVQNSGSDGAFTIEVDTTAPPAVIQPGESWNFQGWYRDQNPGPTSNFTDAVTVDFQ